MLLLANLSYAQFVPTTGNPSGGVQTNRPNMPTNSQMPQNGTLPQEQQDTSEYVQPGIEHHEEIPDSVLLNSIYRFHFTPLAVKILKITNPNLEPTGLEFTDPLDNFNGNYYLSKGTIGQNHIAIYQEFDPSLRPNFRPNSFIGYAKTPQNVNLFQVKKPYTVLSYMGSIHKDNTVHVSHTQNILPRWNISLDYDLYCSEGIYANSGVKNNYLDATTNYYSKDSRYQIQGGVIWQKFNLGENGGLSNDDIFHNNPTSNRAGIPVVDYKARSDNRFLTLFAHQSFNTVRQINKIQPITTQIQDSTEIRDSIIGYDTIIPHKPITFNTGVFGLDLEWNTDKRKYIDSTRWNQFTYKFYWTNDAYPDYKWHNPFKLTIGIEGDEILTSQLHGNWCYINTFGPFAHAEIIPGYGVLSLNAEYRHYWGKYLTDNEEQQNENGMNLSASYQMTIDTTHFITISGAVQEQQPQYIYTVLANQALENFHLKKLSIEYKNSFLNFDISANYANSLPYLTYKENYHNPWQVATSENFWLFQARLQMNLKWNWFHYDMLQLLQHSTDQISMPVPIWATKNSLYADVRFFHKALRAQIGFDIRYHTKFTADCYSPELGIFYHQNETNIGNYVWADVFINLQIKQASIYLKLGHINSLIEQHPNYMLLPHYPGNRFGLMYGLTWKFFD